MWRSLCAGLGALSGVLGVGGALIAVWALHVAERGPDTGMAAGIVLGGSAAFAAVAVVLGWLGRLPRWALVGVSTPLIAVFGQVVWEAAAPARLRVDPAPLQRYVGGPVDALPESLRESLRSRTEGGTPRMRTDEFYGATVVSDEHGVIVSITRTED